LLTIGVHSCTHLDGDREDEAVDISISEARRRLPELVRQVHKDRGLTIRIAVHGEVVAELRAALPEPEPGAAARALLELARRLPRRRRGRTDVSSRVKAHLHGPGE
jgi:antitoxin (DNA-binding transcriptional repressor) of toxin-antitoxin stability system